MHRLSLSKHLSALYGGCFINKQVSNILLQTGLLLVSLSLRHVCGCPR